MKERIFNIFLIMENLIIKSIKVKTHEIDGTDQEKMAFLRQKVVEDLKDAEEFPLPKKYVRVDDEGVNAGEFSYATYSTLIQNGESEQFFEDIYKKLKAPEAVLRVITCVNDGQINIDELVFES